MPWCSTRARRHCHCTLVQYQSQEALSLCPGAVPEPGGVVTVPWCSTRARRCCHCALVQYQSQEALSLCPGAVPEPGGVVTVPWCSTRARRCCHCVLVQYHSQEALSLCPGAAPEPGGVVTVPWCSTKVRRDVTVPWCSTRARRRSHCALVQYQSQVLSLYPVQHQSQEALSLCPGAVPEPGIVTLPCAAPEPGGVVTVPWCSTRARIRSHCALVQYQSQDTLSLCPGAVPEPGVVTLPCAAPEPGGIVTVPWCSTRARRHCHCALVQYQSREALSLVDQTGNIHLNISTTRIFQTIPASCCYITDVRHLESWATKYSLWRTTLSRFTTTSSLPSF